MAAGSRTAFILTVSDRGSSGDRADTSGDGLAARLTALGFTVEREIVPDERRRIESMLVAAASRHPLIVTTGGTGLTPRDVTPQATLAVIDYQVPGFAEAMRADGRAKTPMAILSRAVVGVRGRTLIVNVPGSPRAALESLAVLEPVLDHALETLRGPHEHAGWGSDAG
ncbi:MAG TPA: MogA/MoaB family molybdenum cofactor biosynthesis protein [Verrucomicrobiae bacterium]|jgi:molybdenum cofactor synthesis domain-containing protein|nr:MogA/MoaB family molybdenum cofactor biosynthesis protein [Verrucomicrobiae bacterium]